MKVTSGLRIRHLFLTAALVAGSLPLASSLAGAQTTDTVQQPGAPEHTDDKEAIRRAKAREQIAAQEHQRILGVVPEFNISNISNAVALTPKEKFALAFKSATDPATFGVAAVIGGFGQLTDNYHEYGQGVGGFAKYFGASYADSFNGTILGNALFPSLLHEDPRYFRKGTGSFGSRLAYAMMTTVRCRSDSGKWVPNFGNLMGNLAAGGIANFYYPETDRGATLTIERGFIVTAEGALGAMFYEFWPDVSHHFHKKKQQQP